MGQWILLLSRFYYPASHTVSFTGLKPQIPFPVATALSISLNGGLTQDFLLDAAPSSRYVSSTNYTSGLSRQKVLLLNSLKNIASHAFAAQVGGGSRRVPTILKCPTHPEKVDKGNKKLILRSKQLNLVTKYEIYVEISLKSYHLDSKFCTVATPTHCKYTNVRFIFKTKYSEWFPPGPAVILSLVMCIVIYSYLLLFIEDTCDCHC